MNAARFGLVVRRALLDLVAKLDPKHFQEEPITLGSTTQQYPIMLGLVDLDPKHFRKRLGLTAQRDVLIMGLAG